MAKYDAVIIGAGMSGLVSAIRLSMAGKKVLVVEKQPVPGGFATGFKRKGFYFESSLHCVDALSQGREVRDFLEEAGIAGELEFIESRTLARAIYPGRDFIIETSRQGFIDQLKRSFPAQAKNIDRIFSEFGRFYRHFDAYVDSRLPDRLKLCLTPFFYWRMIKMSCITAGQLIARLTSNKELQAIVGSIWGFMGLPPGKLTAFYFLIVFREYHYYPNCYIRGGFERMFDAMVNRLRKNGSEVVFNASAKKIITNGAGRVKAVDTDKAGTVGTETVISSADCFSTLTKLPDDPAVRAHYAKKLGTLKKSISAFQVYLGLKVPAKELGMNNPMLFFYSSYDHAAVYEASLRQDYGKSVICAVDHAQFDPGQVPAGKGELLIFTLDSYANWQGLDTQAYKKKKEEAAARLIGRVEKYLPGLSKNIEVMETASPLTMERYGSSPEGAIYGLAQTVLQSSINRLPQDTRVKGLFLAGAWTRPGAGIHGCLVSGKDAAEMALKFLK